MKSMTPRARVEAAIRGDICDHVPFTVYDEVLGQSEVERQLRDEGMALITRIPAYRIEMPNVEVWTRQVYEGGRLCRHTLLRTGAGELASVHTWDPAYGTGWWASEHPIKKPDDYRVMESVVRDEVYVPDYERILLAKARLGEDGYVRAKSRKPPMWRLMYDLVGVERLALDMQDYPDEFFSLHAAMWEKDMEMFKVAAKAPVEVMRCGGNFHADMISPKLFRQYYLPYIRTFCDLAHEEGKLVYCHLDAKIGYMVDLIQESGLDMIEAFTPGPLSGMSTSEARQAWPDKVLWINFPSQVHAQSPEEIRSETLTILEEAAPGDRFLIGVTEDVPERAWRTSFKIISQTLLDLGKLPIGQR